jgi:predicted phosphodiesterase
VKRWLVLIFWLAGCAAPSLHAQSAAITFALIGDTPYSRFETYALDSMIEELNRADLAFVIHVGDITAGNGPCSDAWFEERKRQFQKLNHPFVIVPGDNDWVDCHRSGLDPIDRLNKFRELFESGNESLGQRSLRLERQSDDPRHAEYREHMRWISGNVLFVGLNVQGSNNNLGRTPQMDAEYRRRMAAVFAWLDDSAKLARQRNLAGMLIFAQADPDFEGRFRRKASDADGFLEFRNALRALALAFKKPILFVHGDTHNYRFDHPFADPATGKSMRNFARAIVFGSPQTRWVRATIDAEDPLLFRVAPADLFR